MTEFLKKMKINKSICFNSIIYSNHRVSHNVFDTIYTDRIEKVNIKTKDIKYVFKKIKIIKDRHVQILN